ncbi:hypothetical protein NGRA_2266 [Nosema granulosis]|uniref:Uncharacterized protein n=1 Tax=Nosema granulosis TaxID=83296 RepID=A0A9P6GXB8_9MICR|nr:hypothetical protein NGRA_2266 [Nosema granulosis]
MKSMLTFLFLIKAEELLQVIDTFSYNDIELAKKDVKKFGIANIKLYTLENFYSDSRSALNATYISQNYLIDKIEITYHLPLEILDDSEKIFIIQYETNIKSFSTIRNWLRHDSMYSEQHRNYVKRLVFSGMDYIKKLKGKDQTKFKKALQSALKSFRKSLKKNEKLYETLDLIEEDSKKEYKIFKSLIGQLLEKKLANTADLMRIFYNNIMGNDKQYDVYPLVDIVFNFINAYFKKRYLPLRLINIQFDTKKIK